MGNDKRVVLLIDDEEDLIEILAAMINDCTDEVIKAYNGFEGVKILKERQKEISCIVCDIKMPKMDGLEVIKKARELDIKVPFIFYTGHGNEDHMKQALKYGAYDFLYKPCDDFEEVVCKAVAEGQKVKKSIYKEVDVESAFNNILNKSKDV